MSKSFKYLMKQAELAKVAKVANPKTQSAKTGGGEGVAATPGALKIELINPPTIFSQTNAPEHLTPSDTVTTCVPFEPKSPTEEPPASNPSPFEATESVTTSNDTPLPPKPLESQGMAVCEESAEETVAVASRGPGPVPEGVQARVYAKPLNPRMRLIEFVTGPRKGEHGQLWVKDTTQIMLNWRVWVVPDVNRPMPAGLHWVLDGQYNWRGIRVK